jgi:Ca2+/Na+ antiporter
VIYLSVALVGQALYSRSRREYLVADMRQASEKGVSSEWPENGRGGICEKEMIYRRLEELIRRRSSGMLDCKLATTNGPASTSKTDRIVSEQKGVVTTIQISRATLPGGGDAPSGAAACNMDCSEKEFKLVARDQNGNNVIEIVNQTERTTGSERRIEKSHHDHGRQELPRSSLSSTTKTTPNNENKSARSDIKLTSGALNEAALVERLAVASQTSNKFNLDELDHFLLKINPMDSIDWNQSSWLAKVMGLLRAPLMLLTTLTVPVVDNEKLNRNWCRLLNAIQCFTIPIAIVALTNLGGSWWWSSGTEDEPSASRQQQLELDITRGTHRMAGANKSDHRLMYDDVSADATHDTEDVLISCSKFLVFLPGLVLALYVFATTSAAHPPRYHSLFAYFGFLMSVIWIYKLANEIISLLKTIGILFSMSDTAIGLGFLAWGNSLGDIVANLTLAQAGYARMALGASIGAPLLNLLLGFGLSFTVSMKPGEWVPIEYNDTMSLLAGTLALVLVLLMASTFMIQDRFKKTFGYLLITCYFFYFIAAVCLECNLLS